MMGVRRPVGVQFPARRDEHAMATITNKTTKALSVSLPGGKRLHLGPLKSAEIGPKAVERPAVQELIEAGEVEIIDSQKRPRHGGGGGGKGTPPTSGAHGQGSGIRQSGDR